MAQLQNLIAEKVEVYVPYWSRKSDTPMPLWITNKVIKTTKDKLNEWKNYKGEKLLKPIANIKKRRTWFLRLSELLNVGLRKIWLAT